MAKQIVYFNATKQIETLTIHYNSKLDGAFVDDIAQSIKDVAKKMSKVDLKNPKEFESIQVFIYPSKKLFYQVFGGEIEKRFYRRKRSLEDLYVVQDSEGNIHIVSPRGMSQEKRDALKKILVMKVLGQYMEEKEKKSAERLLKESMKPKKEEIEPEEEKELEEQEHEIESEEELDELQEEELEQEELSEEDLEEIIETELIIEQIDDAQEQAEEQEGVEDKKNDEEKKAKTRSEAQEWLSIGWLAYVRGKLKKEEDVRRFANNISKNGVKKLGQLSSTKLFENYNYSQEYACAWVEYIVTTYGMKKFVEHYEKPKDIKGVFGVSKYIFEAQLKAYIKERYKDSEKTLNVTEDISVEDILQGENVKIEKEKTNPISELTQISFEKNGGVNITSDKEIDAPEIKEKI